MCKKKGCKLAKSERARRAQSCSEGAAQTGRGETETARQMTAGSRQRQQAGGSRQEAEEEAESEAGGSNQEAEARKHNENPLGACATRALLTSSSQHRVPTPHLAPAASPLTPCHACVCGAQMSHVFRQLLPRFAVMEKRCSAA